jgi:hypothetical protein
MTVQSIETLREAADAGDTLAMTELGARLLHTGTPAAVDDAVRVLNLAARAGETEAPGMLAALSAMGVGLPQNWVTALNLLQVSADRGSKAARGQLIALAGADPDALEDEAAAPDRWRRLRRAIDPAAWAKPGTHEALCRSPQILRYDAFIPGAVCNWIVARAAGRGAPARVYDPQGPGYRIEDARNNSAIEFALADMDVALAMLRFRIAAAVGVPMGALETSQVLHYETGQRFEPHYDFLDPNLPGHVKDLREQGQRTVTFLVYLNDGFEGGETDFPHLAQRHKPPAGGALCFHNIAPSGAPDRRTLHAGLAPTKGEKWLFSQWIRQRPGAP